MALIKKINNPNNGATASYWMPYSLYLNKILGNSRLVMGGRANKAEYDSKLEPIMTLEWTVPNGTNPQLGAAATAFLISYAKLQPELDGAIETNG